MKCPKCDYVSFDYNQVCPKCKKDVSGEQKRMNLPSFEPSPLSLLGALTGGPDIRPNDHPLGTLRISREEAESAFEAAEMPEEDLPELKIEDPVFPLSGADPLTVEDSVELPAMGELSSKLDSDGGSDFRFSEMGGDDDFSLGLDMEEDAGEAGPGPVQGDDALFPDEELSLSLDPEEEFQDGSPKDEPVKGGEPLFSEEDLSLDLDDFAEEIGVQPEENSVASSEVVNEGDLLELDGPSGDEDTTRKGALLNESEMMTLELEGIRDDSVQELEDFDFDFDIEEPEKAAS